MPDGTPDGLADMCEPSLRGTRDPRGGGVDPALPWPQHTLHPWVAEGRRRLRMGVALVGPRPEWETLVAWAVEAEKMGFDSYWTSDHPLMLPDCWITLAAVAQATHHIRLGTLVTCASYRPPALVARLASDVDRLSGGRVVLGLGIGDQPREFAGMGIPYVSTQERQRALDEAIQIIYGVWERPPFTLSGDSWRVDAASVPAPAQRPHVPLLIAGAGERRTLRQVARYADMSNFGPSDLTGAVSGPESVRHKLSILRAHCDAIGRPYETILRSHFVMTLVLARNQRALANKLAALPTHLRTSLASGMVALTVEDTIVYYRALADAGIQYFIASMPYQDNETLHLLGSYVLPALAAWAERGEPGCDPERSER